MKSRIMLPNNRAMGIAASSLAGANKTGGGGEVMSDAISKARCAGATGGNMALHPTIGGEALTFATI
jgi:hypothetical protein